MDEHPVTLNEQPAKKQDHGSWNPEDKPARIAGFPEVRRTQNHSKVKHYSTRSTPSDTNPQPICSIPTVPLQERAQAGSTVPSLELIQITRNLNGE